MIPLRIFDKIDVKKVNDCWDWELSTSRGYGQLNVKGRVYRAHRYVFELVNGFKPNVVMHTCDNKKCCNPHHLKNGTQADNVRDKVAKSRQSRGLTAGRSKLSKVQVLEIIKKYKSGRGQRSLGREYGVNHQSIGLIIKGKSYRDVTEGIL